MSVKQDGWVALRILDLKYGNTKEMCGGGADEWEGGSIFKLLNVCETAPVILHSQLHTYTHLCSERERERERPSGEYRGWTLSFYYNWTSCSWTCLDWGILIYFYRHGTFMWGNRALQVLHDCYRDLTLTSDMPESWKAVIKGASKEHLMKIDQKMSKSASAGSMMYDHRYASIKVLLSLCFRDIFVLTWICFWPTKIISTYNSESHCNLK